MRVLHCTSHVLSATGGSSSLWEFTQLTRTRAAFIPQTARQTKARAKLVLSIRRISSKRYTSNMLEDSFNGPFFEGANE